MTKSAFVYKSIVVCLENYDGRHWEVQISLAYKAGDLWTLQEAAIGEAIFANRKNVRSVTYTHQTRKSHLADPSRMSAASFLRLLPLISREW